MGTSMSPSRRRAAQSFGALLAVASLGLATAGVATARPVTDRLSPVKTVVGAARPLGSVAPQVPTTPTPTPTKPAPTPTPTKPAPTPTTPAPTTPTVFFGAAGDVDTLTSIAGETVGRHAYGNFQGAVPQGRMITANASGVPWTSVSSAVPGTPMYNNIVRWAQTIKARPGKILFSFGHEPEVVKKAGLGTPEEYRAAYQRVWTIFRQQGVTNVSWVYQTTAWAYRVNQTALGSATTWYPGDAYVDVVGGDAYNWNTCGLPGQNKSVPLSTIAGGILTFAKAHNKKASLPEFAATSAPDRAQWLSDGYKWLKANNAYFVAAYYFNRPPTNPDNMDCVWWLNTPSEYATYKAIIQDTWTVS
ncbi:glycosyl hydrolase [Phycicoccus jejuensis]|uniref:glycosyl hydrolase n=1 Tax=Phycicoccus jejuensis TaxID=367299 RepID=UPI0012F84B71|nr:glycosyl hydrolase [Phycicoccus jejuensis]